MSWVALVKNKTNKDQQFTEMKEIKKPTQNKSRPATLKECFEYRMSGNLIPNVLYFNVSGKAPVSLEVFSRKHFKQLKLLYENLIIPFCENRKIEHPSLEKFISLAWIYS